MVSRYGQSVWQRADQTASAKRRFADHYARCAACVRRLPQGELCSRGHDLARDAAVAQSELEDAGYDLSEDGEE